MKPGLNVKFICYTVFTVLFISLVFSAVFVYQSRKALLHEFHTKAESLVKNLALNIEVPLLIENKPALTAFAQNLLKESDVQSVQIIDHDNNQMVSLSKGRMLLPWEKEKIICPVRFSPETGQEVAEEMQLFGTEGPKTQDEGTLVPGQVIGSIEVMFSRQSIIKKLNRIRLWIFLAAIFAAVIGAIAGWYFSHTLIMPIQRLARATYSIARGNWEERLEVRRKDELGQLTESFNIMAQSLVTKKQQLESTYKELAQKDKMAEIGKFSMIIAHELKNPLGIIKGSVDILDKPATEAVTQETMKSYIRDEVKRLNKLIEDFLAFARPMPPQKTFADVNDTVRKISGHFMIPEELNKDISLQIDLGDPPRIAIDENQIYQALLNLINNAVQAIEQKGEIHIKTDCQDRRVRIQVSDSGPGLSAEVKNKIFEPFFTTKAKGSGLGLTIVKKFVENHSGYIEVADFSEGGTTVSMFFPMQES